MSAVAVEEDLPIAALRSAFVDAIRAGPVVVSSPTGSGKSTQIPRWCARLEAPSAPDGRVLVIEPRRVACRSLAARLSDLEGAAVGQRVGYVVRDESVMDAGTRIVFATPGVVLRQPALLASAGIVVLDEFHERSLDVDLLLALLLRRGHRGLVVMSATLEGERVARHIGGAHLVADGRTFPVDIRFTGKGGALPEPVDLAARVGRALQEATAGSGDAGDVLVFLPGKAEITACANALLRSPFAVVLLHGGLSLDQQRRAFEPLGRRKVILATNVAETSITIPGVGIVIDAGLVRQTRYRDGRSSLALVPIAEDAAAQRAGRAGRTSSGVGYRLWGPSARLAATTLPEVHRESLVPLVLSAAAWGERVPDLPLLDAPKAYALEAARVDLEAWGALAEDGALTEGGRAIFSLPIEPALARFLVEARGTGCLGDAIDLVAALSVGRPLFLAGPPPPDPHDDLRLAGCDATALVQAVRAGVGRESDCRLSTFVLDEARRVRSRLRRIHGLPEARAGDSSIDGEALARTAILADPRVVHVARARGGGARAFSNGGTELELARESAVHLAAERLPAHSRGVEALVVFETRAFGAGRAARLVITCATPIPLAWIARLGLGRDRVGAVRLERGRAVAEVERVYAKRVVATREEVPSGELARAAIAELFTRGSLFRTALETTRERLAIHRLAAKLAARGHPAGWASGRPIPSLEEWVAARLAELGVETGDDVALLSAEDLVFPDVPFEARDVLQREFPLRVVVGDATYDAEYDLERSQVLLRAVGGARRELPPLAYLPRFAGLRVCVDGPRGVATLRDRR